MRIRMIGPLQVTTADGTIDLGGTRLQQLLALLVVYAGETVSADRLAYEMWGEHPPQTARKTIQGYVSALRRALGRDVIETTAAGYRFDMESITLDTVEFMQAAGDASGSTIQDPEATVAIADAGLKLWAGEPFAGLPDTPAFVPERTRIRDARSSLIESRLTALVLAGHETAALNDLASVLADNPLNERLWALRMVALYRTGQQTAALRCFDEARRGLAEEVGLEPGHELKLVEQRVVEQNPILEGPLALVEEPESAKPTRNPYKGLRTFHEADAEDFYGRDSLVRRLRERLDSRDHARLIVLTGPSGSGKSSVVRAGLIPTLRRDGWDVETMYPGADPLTALMAVTQRHSDQPLASSLVVVDQCEELFTLVQNAEVRDAFLAGVVETVNRQGRGPWVLATVRADFLDPLMSHEGFAELLGNALIIVPQLKGYELQEVVERPASRVGVAPEPALVAEIVRDAGERPSSLPLLQFALTDLFDRSAGETMTLDSYRAAGGITGALIGRVESLYESLDEPDRESTRQLLLRLVALSEGSEPTKRRVSISALSSVPSTDEVVANLVEHRLLTLDRDTRGQATVEIGHEALLEEWPRLKSWIDEARADLYTHAKLAEATIEWEAANRSEDYLLSDARLTRLTDIDESNVALTEPQRAFVEASIGDQARRDGTARRRRRVAMASFAVIAAVALVLAGIATLTARLANDRAREARAETLAASSAAALDDDPELAVLLGIEALKLSPDSSAAASALDAALQAHRTIFTVNRSSTPPATGSISPDGQHLAVVSGWETLELFEVGIATPLWRMDADEGWRFEGASFTVDGDILVPQTQDNKRQPMFAALTWALYEPLTGDLLHTVDVSEPCTIDQWSWGGANTSTGFADVSHPLFLSRFEVLPDGQCAEVQSGPAELVGFDLWTGETVPYSDYWPSPVGVPTASGDGSRIAFSSGGPGAVLDIDSGEMIRELDPFLSTISIDGSRALVSTQPLELIEVDSGNIVTVYPGDYTRAYFGSSGRRIIASSFDGSTRVMDSRDGRVIYELRGAGSRDLSVQMTLDETLAATFSRDGTARVWDIGSQLQGTASSSAYSSDNPDRFLTMESLEVTPQFALTPVGFEAMRETAVFDIDTWERVRTLEGRLVAISPDGSTLVMQSRLGRAEQPIPGGGRGFYNTVAGMVLVDTDTGATIREFEQGPCLWYVRMDAELPGPSCGDYPDPWMEWAVSGSYSADGALFALGGGSGYAAVWDVETGELVHFFDTALGGTQLGRPTRVRVAFSPVADELAVYQWVLGSTPTIRRIDTTNWGVTATLEFPDDQAPTAMAFAPNGSVLVVGDAASDLHIVDARTWEVTSKLEGQQGGQIHDVAISPDSKIVAAGGDDQALWVWDLENEIVVRRIQFDATAAPDGDSGLTNVEFVNETTIVVASEVSAVLITLDPEVLLRTARSRITRSLTPQECATYRVPRCS